MSEEADAIQPEYEVALERFASGFRIRQEQIPLWIAESLRAYGVACCKRGIKLAHAKKTLKSTVKGPWDDEETPIEIRWEDDEENR